MAHVNGFKAAVTAIIATLTALWGLFGWFCIILAACMAIDYLTGTAVAKKDGKWQSHIAREGLWHKLAIVVAVIVAGILDMVVGMIVNNIPSVSLPFEYTVIFAPMVVTWYIITELGSILENSGKLGGPQPKWFKKAIAAIKSNVDKAGDKLSQQEKQSK